MASGSFYDAANFTAMDFVGIEADMARIVSYEFGVSGSPLMAHQIVRAARGPILVEILDVGIGLSQQAFVELLQETFERVNKALNPTGQTTGSAPDPPVGAGAASIVCPPVMVDLLSRAA